MTGFDRFNKFLAGVSAVLLFGQVSYSTMVISMDIPTLVQSSCSVILGEVVEIEKNWVPVSTDYQVEATLVIRVEKVFKSCPGIHPGDLVPVMRPGGSIGDAGTIVPGSPTFMSGRKVLLFLMELPDGSHIITGLSQGKFRIMRDSDTLEEVAIQDKAAGRLHLVDSNDPSAMREMEKPVPDRMRAEDLFSEIEKITGHPPKEADDPESAQSPESSESPERLDAL